MGLFPMNVGGGGTALGFTALTGSTGSIACHAISVRGGVATVLNAIGANQTVAMPDGDMSIRISGSGTTYTRTYTFIKAGYYCVNGTWSYKTANSTQQVSATEGYVFYYEDLKQH